MKSKPRRIHILLHNTLGIVPNSSNRSRAMRPVTVTVDVPHAVVGIASIPAGDRLDGGLGEVDVAEVVAGVDDADCDWIGRRWQLCVCVDE